MLYYMHLHATITKGKSCIFTPHQHWHSQSGCCTFGLRTSCCSSKCSKATEFDSELLTKICRQGYKDVPLQSAPHVNTHSNISSGCNTDTTCTKRKRESMSTQCPLTFATAVVLKGNNIDTQRTLICAVYSTFVLSFDEYLSCQCMFPFLIFWIIC